MSIADNLKQVLAELPQGVRLVAVSKFHPNEAIEEAYQAGQRIFGESKVQEMTAKYETLPKDIEWHFIGHLQTNKIKYMIPYVAMIHGIDTYKLLTEVNMPRLLRRPCVSRWRPYVSRGERRQPVPLRDGHGGRGLGQWLPAQGGGPLRCDLDVRRPFVRGLHDPHRESRLTPVPVRHDFTASGLRPRRGVFVYRRMRGYTRTNDSLTLRSR